MKSYIRFAYKEPISLSFILENNGLNDAFWVLLCIKNAVRDICLFNVWCARQVQHLMRDSRSTNALDGAERYANGKATKEELEAASAAANAARDAASRARDAVWTERVARDAASAAREAASAAASAARETASAASDAALAARDAVWAASRARDAVWTERVAWDAALAAQTEMFKLMCDGKAPWQVSGLD